MDLKDKVKLFRMVMKAWEKISLLLEDGLTDNEKLELTRILIDLGLEISKNVAK
jgi:hypothetical protein